MKEEKQTTGWTWKEYQAKQERIRQWGKDHPFLHGLQKLWYFLRYGIRRRIAEALFGAKMGLQRMFRGYDDTDWYSYSTANADRAVKALRRLRKEKLGYPMSLYDDDTPPHLLEKEWNRILDTIIAGFEAELASYDVFIEDEEGNYDREATNAEHRRLRALFGEGMELYVKHYQDLWD